MKFTIVNSDYGQARNLTFRGWTRALLSVCLLGIPTVVGAWGYSWLVNFDKKDGFNGDAAAWDVSAHEQKNKLEKSRKQSVGQVAAFTTKDTEWQARLVLPGAFGERIAKVAELDKGKFDFRQPGLGDLLASIKPDGFPLTIDRVFLSVQNRDRMIKFLQSILWSRGFYSESVFDLSPVETGYMLSTFGCRTKSFNAKNEFRSGIDFTAPAGTEIDAFARVVTKSVKTNDNGNRVDANCDGTFETRYSRNKVDAVQVGNVVKKGQIVTLVRSAGRSTVPSDHLDVYQNGRVVDPATYLHIASR